MKYILTAALVVSLFTTGAHADRYRSAESGRYVTSGHGAANPSTTVKESR